MKLSNLKEAKYQPPTMKLNVVVPEETLRHLYAWIEKNEYNEEMLEDNLEQFCQMMLSDPDWVIESIRAL